MRYLITGGGGFIGSHLADRLIGDGHQVHIFDNLSTGRRDNFEHLVDHPRFSYTIGDVLNDTALEEVMRDCDQVFHLAAAVGVKLIMEKPVETIVTNVRGTETVLEVAHQQGKKVLVASTSEVYGKAMEVNGGSRALSEQDNWTLGPTNKRRWAYACSKALDEFMALAYYDEKRLPVVIVRFFNTVGPRQSGRYGMVIPNFVQAALRHQPIPVYGDGEQSRSFTHVADAVRAIIALMNCKEAEGGVFNVGNGAVITMNALAERVRELTRSESDIRHIPYREVYGAGFEDMRERTPDISKIRGFVGFQPQHDIDTILTDVIAYTRGELARQQGETATF
jgi:UDP-glucose 4-epimerase